LLVRAAQMPSMVAAGCCGTNSESSTTVLLPRSVSSRPALPLGVPPRKTQLRKVMFEPVTVTKPWKSLPVMTAPFVLNVWLPLTTVNAIPATTPVLFLPGFPVRGVTGPGFWCAAPDLLADGDGEALADALGCPDAEGPALAPSLDAGSAQLAAVRVEAHALTGMSSSALTRAIAHGLAVLGIIVLLTRGEPWGHPPPTLLGRRQASKAT